MSTDRKSLSRIERWKLHAAELRSDTYALYLACRDPRVPWLPKFLAANVVAYALSPIDLIPDFIPVIGYLDDLILVPLGLALVIRLVPEEVMAAHRATAAHRLSGTHHIKWAGAAIVLIIWGILLVWLFILARRMLGE